MFFSLPANSLTLCVSGCKIKGLRAKTNTYIKTPMRIEEPVFVVTGRKEDVAVAKREILSAAEHFSQIRASRKNNNSSGGGGGGGTGNNTTNGPPTNCPGHITAQLPVPLKEVGLVVGPKGATIKRIQQQTQTYIVTPGRDKKPIFEVTGLPENVEKACQEIRSYLDRRTGRCREPNLSGSMNGLNGSMNGLNGSMNGLNGGLNGSMNSLNNTMNGLNNSMSGLNSSVGGLNNPMTSLSSPLTGLTGLNIPEPDPTDFPNGGHAGVSMDSGFHDLNTDLLSSIFKPPSTNSAFSSYKGTSNVYTNDMFNLPPPPSSKMATDFAGFPPTTSSSVVGPGLGLCDSDEGIGSPSFDSMPLHTPSIWSEFDGPNLVLFTPIVTSTASVVPPVAPPTLMCARSAGSSSTSPTDSTGSAGYRRSCIVCKDGDVVAALVPCGHNVLCMDCANRIMETDRCCPAHGCHLPPTQAIRIFS